MSKLLFWQAIQPANRNQKFGMKKSHELLAGRIMDTSEAGYEMGSKKRGGKQLLTTPSHIPDFRYHHYN